MRRYLFASVAMMALVLLPFASADAAELRFGERVSTGPNETLTEDVYLGAGMVDSAASITGDLLVGGGNITIDSAVSEDVMTAGGNVTVLGDVADDLRIAGGSITIAGSVGDDVAIVAGQTQLSGDGVGGDVLWMGGALSVNAPVGGDMRLAGGEVYINSPVSGNVEFNGDKLILGSGAVIQGDLSYRSPREVEMEDGAVVQGEITYDEVTSAAAPQRDTNRLFAIFSIGALVALLMRLTGALVLGLGLRRYTNDLVSTAFARPLAELGRGFVVVVVMPIAAIVLMVTVIGLPLGILTLVAYIATLIFAVLMAPILLGSLVHKWVKKPKEYNVSWLTILLGVMLFAILGFIPILGWIIQCIFVLFTVGAATRIKWGILREYLGR